MLERLIDGKARRLGGQLKQNAGRLAEVDGAEVIAINDGRRIEACFVHAVTQSQLRSIVDGAPSDVVHRASPAHALNEAANGPNLYDGSGATVAGRESPAEAFFGYQLEAQAVEDLQSGAVFFHPQSH